MIQGLFMILVRWGGNSDAYDINNLGQMVGRSHTDPAGTALHAFLYNAGMMIDLGTFPGGVQSTAYAINNVGQVVNEATVPTGTHQAFLYEAGALYNLNDLIPASAGWILERGEDINDAGQIVGFGIVGGERHAFLLTPTPEDSTPPVITIAASPTTLSPPNGRLVTVTVSGTITDDEPDDSGVQAGSTVYRVMDEYGQVQPSGSFTLETDGRYAFPVALQASRRGNDQDGRRYTIEVNATDYAGNEGSASATVTVPRN
jgi:probable HAF family extracellular repeat protein